MKSDRPSPEGLVRVIAVDPASPDANTIDRAARALLAGRLVAFPTETVYGLGANALDATAVHRIFEAKERPRRNPLIVHAADADAARRVVAEWPPAAGRLARAFWPGPLTLVVPKRPELPAEVTAGLDTVAVRVPSHPVARALLDAAGVPVAAPSANPFTGVSPTTAEHVVRGLGDRVDIVLDAGPTPVGIESTVVDLTREPPAVLRPGMISVDALEEVLGEPAAPSGPVEEAGAAGLPSPGMLPRHYSPRATVRLFGRDEPETAEALAREASAHGERVGALLLRSEPTAAIDRPIRMPEDPDAYARRLYAALHELDDDGCDLVLVEGVPDSPAWAAIRDRLIRAAS